MYELYKVLEKQEAFRRQQIIYYLDGFLLHDISLGSETIELIKKLNPSYKMKLLKI